MDDNHCSPYESTRQLNSLRARVIELEQELERSRSEVEDLRAGEARQRLFSENVRDIIWTLDLEFRYTYISPSIKEVMGFSADEAMEKMAIQAMTPASAERAREAFMGRTIPEQADPDQSLSLELEFYHKDGGTVWIEAIISYLRDVNGVPNGIIGVSRDITKRRKAEAEVGKWAQVFEHAHWGIAIASNGDGRLDMVNEAYANLHGWEVADLVGKPIGEVYAPGCERDLISRAESARRDGRVVFETRHIRADGTEFPVRVDAVAIRDSDGEIAFWAVHALDLTEEKRGEKVLRVASRMEATATLAGGIAHDFNNLMVGVLGNASLASMHLEENHPCARILSNISKAAEQAGSLSQQLLAYARGGKYHPKVINLNATLAEVIQLQSHTIPSRIRMVRDMEDDLWNTFADPAQINQIVMNLGLNAVEAIAGHGEIRIETRNVEGSAIPSSVSEEPIEGHYVSLVLEDTGHGMDDETRVRVFEPFFSTRAQGRGLGLAAVYGIVTNHDGFIVAENLENGARFTVYLPACEEVISVERKAPSKPEEPGGETVLIIEDEEMVMDVTRQLLERMGYNVVCAADGEAAIVVAREYPEDIHVAMLDLGMPVMGGAEAFPHLREARPDMPVLICSGYELGAASQELLDAGASGFLQKPYRAEALNQSIREALRDPMEEVSTSS